LGPWHGQHDRWLHRRRTAGSCKLQGQFLSVVAAGSLYPAACIVLVTGLNQLPKLHCRAVQAAIGQLESGVDGLSLMESGIDGHDMRR
jgi:hypothetical protein